MGFHLVNMVYDNVKGTSPTEQSVLAYLAHRADDKTGQKCYPIVDKIVAATHFKHSSVSKALNKLRELGLLDWKTGGRHKGGGGQSRANEYTFTLPPKPPSDSIHQADNAYSTRRSMHTPPDGQCILHQTDTINHSQPLSQPSVIGKTEAATEGIKIEMEKVADSWKANREVSREDQDIKKRTHISVVDEAMKAAGVTDIENKKIFNTTLVRRDPDMSLEVIWRFASERRAHEHDHLRNPAAALNKILSQLPVINCKAFGCPTLRHV